MTLRSPLVAQLGEIMQLAFVPRDFDSALGFWTKTMGVGPFFLREHVALDDLRYRGEPTDPDFDVAIAYWGEIQVELIRQHNDAPSIYRGSPEAEREGLHHVCLVVDDLDHARAVCREAGAAVIQEGRLPGGAVIYVDPGDGSPTLVEIIQLPPAGVQGFAYMREQARNWDGADPVRRLG
jgi:methylmalonyl-CoA/ethylmalonyl-CoA epimerase